VEPVDCGWSNPGRNAEPESRKADLQNYLWPKRDWRWRRRTVSLSDTRCLIGQVTDDLSQCPAAEAAVTSWVMGDGTLKATQPAAPPTTFENDLRFMSSGQAIIAPASGVPAFDREKRIHCGACLWNCTPKPPAGVAGRPSADN
jgi:hypothetical protein